ncbi:MAG: sialidase family protein, partial [Spirochaetaceae bacterium]|nr:sialidase family protein [Spirochaetaceae bacterium]
MATEPDLAAAGGDRPTPEEAARNVPLLAGYDYDRYPSSITGFTGVNLQRVFVRRQAPAVRTRVGPRGNFKGAIARLSDGTLVAAACRRIDIHGLFGVHVYRSADRGSTWREVGETTLYGKEMSLTALPDDSLLLTVESTAVPGNGIRMRYHRSTDGGLTWTTDSLDGLGKPRNVLVEADG